MGIVVADYLVVVAQGMITVCAPLTVLRARRPGTYAALAAVGVAVVVLLRPEFGVAPPQGPVPAAAVLLSLLLVTALPFCLLRGSVRLRLVTLCLNWSNMVVCEMIAYAMLEVRPDLRRRMVAGEELLRLPAGDLAGVLCVKAWSLTLLLLSVLVMRRFASVLLRATSAIDGAVLARPMRLRTLLLCCVTAVVSCGFLVPGMPHATPTSYLSVLAISCGAAAAFLGCDCLIVALAGLRARGRRARQASPPACEVDGLPVDETGADAERIRRMARMRHDLNNQLAVIGVMSAEGDWDGAAEHARVLKAECQSALGKDR